MKKYKLVKKLGDGTFSDVFKAQSIENGGYVAIKCMKASYSSYEEVSKLREIRALKRLSTHENIISLLEVLYDEQSGRLGLVFELMEKNLYEAIKDRKYYISEKKIKNWIYQVLKALEFMHRNGIFHRDIKPENILLRDNIVKLADLGSCKGIYSKIPFTEYISTRWYRSPECLLTDGYYNYKMDIWGLGCVFFEMLTLFPLFPGNDEIDQVNKIHRILGTPSKELFNKLIKNSTRNDIVFEHKNGTGIKRYLSRVTPECIDLLNKMLAYDPDERYTAKQCLNHIYFRDLADEELKFSRISLMNFRRNPLHAMILSSKFNESNAFRNDESYLMESPHKQIKNKKEENINNQVVLPDIKKGNFMNKKIIVSSEGNNILEDFDVENTKRDMATFVRLPKIGKKEKNNKYMNVNNLKRLIKDNINNQGFADLNNNTQYAREKGYLNIRKRVNYVKKNYVSPYSKNTISNYIQIL